MKVSYEETGRRVDALTDHQGFERLVTILLARTGLNVRPLGGSGDRGRDAVVGLYRADTGEDLAVTISLNASWAAKIRALSTEYETQALRHLAAVNEISVAEAKALEREAKAEWARRSVRRWRIVV